MILFREPFPSTEILIHIVNDKNHIYFSLTISLFIVIVLLVHGQ